MTRLADELVASRFDGWRSFAERLKAAVRFEISPEVGAMAHAIKGSNAARLKAAMEFCRLPFDLVWFEWVGPAAALGVRADDEPANPQRPPPSRMGFLVEAACGRLNAGLVSYAWSHGRTGPMVCPLATTFDWAAVPSAVPSLMSDQELAASWLAGMRAFPHFAKDSAADLLALRGRHGVVPCPHLAHMLVQLTTRDPTSARAMFEAAWDDIRGEQRFVESLLATMNCRNLVQAEAAEDLSVLNKARRRLGRPPRLSFRKVVVSLSRVQSRKAAASGASATGGMPLHIVRGHPKVRKTGIYWWSPFWRGDATNGRVERSGYEVRR
jgi:hypothetical protein